MATKKNEPRRPGKRGGSPGRSDETVEQDKGKRKSLRAILAGSGIIAGVGGKIPGWEKPVIDSIMLPAHAQTSPIEAPSTTPPE